MVLFPNRSGFYAGNLAYFRQGGENSSNQLPSSQHHLYQRCLTNCYQKYQNNKSMYTYCICQCRQAYGYRHDDSY